LDSLNRFLLVNYNNPLKKANQNLPNDDSTNQASPDENINREDSAADVSSNHQEEFDEPTNEELERAKQDEINIQKLCSLIAECNHNKGEHIFMTNFTQRLSSSPL